MKIFHIIAALYTAAFLFSCGGGETNGETSPAISVTTSYLETAASDLLGNSVSFVRVVPPGMCPGHFDIAPGTVRDIRDSRMMLRFEFQKSLDSKISSLIDEEYPIFGIKAPEGLCIPESYLDCLQQTHESLVTVFPSLKQKMDSNYDEAQKKIGELEKEIRKTITDHELEGVRVIASGHQSKFCRRMGLDVVAVYSGAERTTPRKLKEMIDEGEDAQVQYIIANLQEGARMAEALSARLDCDIVTFSNFPDMSEKQDSFYELIRYNLHQLAQAEQANRE